MLRAIVLPNASERQEVGASGNQAMGPLFRDGGKPIKVGRRAILRGAIGSVAGVVIGGRVRGGFASAPPTMGATPSPGNLGSPSPESKVLLVYFSRAGENYYYGGRTDLKVGNTEVLAGMIRQRIGCDVYRIEAADPYSESYDATVARNVREQDANARPAVANPLASIACYDTVLLGSPIWNVRPPMIMWTFAERFDFTGKTIFPFTTYAVSGLGTAVRDYTTAYPGATIGEGLAVRGEEVHEAGPAVASWLQRIGLLKR